MTFEPQSATQHEARESACALLPSSLVNQAYESLYARIADGVLAPDERLVISKLAEEFKTSAIPVREALARLLATRLVTFEPNRGYRVAPRPTEETIRHFFQMRLVLESGAVDLGIANVDDAVLKEMEALNLRIAEGKYGRDFNGFREFTALNEKFHNLLVGLSANPLLIEAYEQLADYHQKIRYNAGIGVPDLSMIAQEHSEIIAALRERDTARARCALASHINDGFGRLVGAPPIAPSAGAEPVRG